jgi:hypothetical protein
MATKHIPETDPSLWALAAAHSIVIGVDVAFATGGDHSAMIVGGVWLENGRSVIGVIEIVQFPTGTTADELADTIASTARKYGNPRVVFDASNNSAFASILAARFPTNPSNYLVGAAITGAAEHAAQPTPFPVSLLGQKTIVPRWTLSKRELIESVSAELDNKSLKLGMVGDWEALRDEFAVMERVVNAAGTVRYSAPAGKKDDMILALSLCVFGLRRIGAPIRRVNRPRRERPGSLAWT